MEKIKLISVVLPVYNQANHIQKTIEEYLAKTKVVPVALEFILVVNGSTDQSHQICTALEEKYPQVIRAYSLDAGGWGLAVRHGINQAKGDLICYTNSARTSGNDLLLFLLYSITNHGMVIKANRRIRDNWMRRFGSLLYNLEARSLFDLAYWDINGTPKIFPRECSKLFEMTESGDLVDLEFNIICRENNYPVVEIPIISAQNREGKSTTNYNSAAKMYFGAYHFWKTKRMKSKNK